MNAWEFLAVFVVILARVAILGGCAYLVGWHDWSAWWFVVAAMFSSVSVKTGKAAEDDD